MKKKGFTLIELLAVIVILAIIALIATPLVLKYIDKSNKEALKNSIYSIDRSIVMKGTLDRKDKEYTSTDELDVKIKDTDIKISYVDGETRYYKVSNENYLLDVKKCPTKKYCTIDEIKNIKNVIIHKNELFPSVVDNNPGIICGEGTTEDTTLTTCHIRSIEDLVQLSTLVNKGTTFKDKTIELVNSLDFNEKKSYASRKVDDSLIKDEGFTPIGGSKPFQGTFNGNDNTIKGLYINRPETSNMGLFGYVDGVSISNLKFEDVNIIGKTTIGTLIGKNQSAIVENICLKNINLESIAEIENSYFGGLIGVNYSPKVSNITAENVNIDTKGSYIGGLIGQNSGELIENVVFNNINVSGDWYSSGVVGHSSIGKIQNIVGNNFKIKSTGRYSGGLIARSDSSLVTQVKLTNVNIEGLDRAGILLGNNTTGTLTNAKAEGNVKGTSDLALAVGYIRTGTINKVVVKGNVEGSGSTVGGLIGRAAANSQEDVANISGVFLSGSVKTKGKRILGSYNSIPIIINTLASSQILVNGSTVDSTDPTSLHGKSLDNMGKASQSEYEKLGFEFESTDTNEAYWYFNEDDELDLIIK